MLDFRSTLKYLGVFAAGAVIAGFFFSGLGGRNESAPRPGDPDYDRQSDRQQQVEASVCRPPAPRLVATSAAAPTAAAQQTVAPHPDALRVPLPAERQIRVIAITRPDQPNATTAGSTPRATAQPADAPQAEAPAVRPVRVIAIERPVRTETNGSGGLRREATGDVASDAEADNEAAPAGCNVAVCRQFYRSFDARTCTYRSYQGTTRLCAK